MLYLNDSDLLRLDTDWNECVDAIDDAVRAMDLNDFAQPVKPYLRYRDLTNRIIAMPAFLGGRFELAGIKWIASFPKNIDKGLPRAHAVVVLNEAGTGRPFAVVNSGLVSAIRTAAVSGSVIRHSKVPARKKLSIGMTGFGPIGTQHAAMLHALLGDRISELVLFDPRLTSASLSMLPKSLKARPAVSWQEAYLDADVFLTCTVSTDRYIDLTPKKGSLHLNVSLRDYQPAVGIAMNQVVVDDWEEVCRENTDVEVMTKT